MGTKRPFDEELQEFIKHPKHCDYSNKPALFVDNNLPPEKSQNVGIAGDDDGLESVNVFTVPDMVYKEFQTTAPLPLVTSINGDEDDDGAPVPVFCSDLFPEFFEFNMPRRQLVHYDDTYSSFLNCSPRKEIPIGPDHQADVPEFDPELARNYHINYDNNGGEANFVGVCVIPMSNSDNSTEEGETVDSQTDCKCLDGGSIRCVQQHVKEARLKLKQSLGDEKFIDLGMCDMGEEVACKWTEEEEQIFHEIVYCNPVSLGKRYWDQLSTAFPSRTKKELVSYYFNVFILRRRAVQNRYFLEIDSDDDEWWGSDKTPFGVRAEDEDFVVGGSFFNHGDNDSSSDDGDDDDGGQSDVSIGIKEDSCTSFEDQHFRPNSCNHVDEKSSAITHN